MYLIISIVLSSLFGLLLFILSPWVGGIIAFGILAGGMFRGLYLLNDIHKRISKLMPNSDPAREAYENYLNERKTKAKK